MARFERQIFSFSGGEISPVIARRPDLEVYKRSLSYIQNFIPQYQGNIKRRVGFQRVLRLYDFQKDAMCQLIPFYDGDKDIMIVCHRRNLDGNIVMKFIQNGGFYVDGRNDVLQNKHTTVYVGKYDTFVYLSDNIKAFNGTTNFDMGMMKQQDENLIPIDTQDINITYQKSDNNKGVKFPDLKNVLMIPISSVDGKSIMDTLKNDTTNYVVAQYIFGGSNLNIDKFSHSQLDENTLRLTVKFKDTVKRNFAPYDFKKGRGSYYLEKVVYPDPNSSQAQTLDIDTVTANGTAISGVENIDAYYTVSIITENDYQETVTGNIKTIKTDQGVNIKVKKKLDSGDEINYAFFKVYKSYDQGNWGFIGQSKTAEFLDNGFRPDYKHTPVISEKDLLNNKHVESICSYNQRVVYGALDYKPMNIIASNVGTFNTFNRHVPYIESDSYNFTINVNVGQSIKHIIDFETLIVFTNKAVWNVSGSDLNNLVVTPTSVQVTQLSSEGASSVLPIKYKDVIIYTGNTKQACYIINNQKNIQKITELVEHLFYGKTITSMCGVDKHNLIFISLSDGTLLSLTLNFRSNTFAFARHNTEGEILYVNSIYNSDTNNQDVYVIVKRKPIDNTNTVFNTYVERLVLSDLPYNLANPYLTGYFDCWSVYNKLYSTSMQTQIWDTGNGFTVGKQFAIKINISNSYLESKIKAHSRLAFYNLEMKNKILFHVDSVDTTDPKYMLVKGTANKTISQNYMMGYIGFTFDEIDLTQTGFIDDFMSYDTVSILADGDHLGNFQVSTFTDKKKIILNKHYSIVQIGIPYASRFKTLPIRTTETFVGDKNISIQKCYIDYQETRGLKVYCDNNPSVTTVQDFNKILETKGKEFYLTGNLSLQNKLVVEQTNPFPADIITLSMDISVS